MTTLQPGIRVVCAPHFHLGRPWAEQLQINSGVVSGDGCLIPRDDWRQPSPEEIALLTAPGSDSADSIALFNIPERLRGLWWEGAIAQASSSQGSQTAFQNFAAQVLEFLQFKRLPLPPSCTFEIAIKAPGLATTQPPPGGLASGEPDAGVLGAINLSDEVSALIFLNLGVPQLLKNLPHLPQPTSLHFRARVFLTAFPNYPLIRLALRPGEGFWLPASEVVTDCDTRGRSEVDVQLVLRGA